ncbi:MAG: IclR family transcriptional regulator, acetate operon repressor [Chloroflexota bacterium]|jgi:IclR family acetate operon transcriptional repressor|nr:IclR family transcriptional regulator, acetate operon repressor [Chloroflexota bacterium]
MKSKDGDVATLKTVDRALTVLEIVAASPDPLPVRRVATALGHNVSSTYHLVNTLVARGYLAKDRAGELRIGARVGSLYAALSRSSDLARQMRPILERLAVDCGETVYLTHLIIDRVVIEIVIESAQSLRVTGLAVGYSGSEDRRASGKAVMAHLPPDDFELVLEHALLGLSDAERAARRARLDAEIVRIRELGYAVDHEEFEVGVVGLGVPFFDAQGKVVGSVTVTAPTVREKQLLGPIKDQIRQAADDISAELHAPASVRSWSSERST